MQDSVRFDTTKLDSGQLLFRQIDRILQTTAKEYTNTSFFLTSLYCQIEGLKNMMVEEMFKQEETKDLKEIMEEKEKAYSENYSNEKKRVREVFSTHMKFFNYCIKVLARNGYIFRKQQTGDDDDENGG